MTLKGLLQFITLALYILGAIGGFGYACYSGAYLIAVAVLVLAVMAFPTAKRIFKEWTE
jgi:uncharacterized membrane protein